MLDVLTKARDLDAIVLLLFVLDEADRVLGMGFAKTLNSIIAMNCQLRNTIVVFGDADYFWRSWQILLRNPVRVTVRDSNAALFPDSGGNKNEADKKKELEGPLWE